MKKVAFITHSFHKKSKSVNILAEEIFNKEIFLTDFFYIDDWTLSPTGLNEDIIGYDIVVIIQLISLDIISKIKCKNIVFLPMYDFSYSWDIFKWLECINLKILSSTKKLHDKLCDIGLNSYYFKYYPEPLEYIPGDLKKLFLWQRVNDINIKTTLQLLNNFPIEEIHLHKAIDPSHTFVEPSQNEIEQYNIVFSEWFESRENYFDILEKSGIYIAPRLMEGGAAAFIDAMRMGKVVIANNDSAMNEYITHNENGLLYDAHDVQAIDFNSVDLGQMQENAYRSVKEGRIAWRESIPGILNFIESNDKVVLENNILNLVRDSRETLRREHALLEEKVGKLQIEIAHHQHIVKYDHWYGFGQLSKKEKIKKIFKMIYKKINSKIFAKSLEHGRNNSRLVN